MSTPLSKKLYSEYDSSILKSSSKQRGKTLISQITIDNNPVEWERVVNNEDLIEIRLDKELDINQKIKILFEYTKNIGLDLIVSCWDIESLIFAHKYGIKTLKIASADLTNKLLIDKSLKLFKNIIMSTGMSSESEIEDSIKLIKKKKEQIYAYCIALQLTQLRLIHLT